jgi:hypothetical protein
MTRTRQGEKAMKRKYCIKVHYHDLELKDAREMLDTLIEKGIDFEMLSWEDDGKDDE